MNGWSSSNVHLIMDILVRYAISASENTVYDDINLMEVIQKEIQRLKDMDKKRIGEIMEYEWFKNKEWQEQMKKCLKLGVRIEQQALANKSLAFIAKEYLPQKIENEVFLP